MDKRIKVNCFGLYIRTSSGKYRKVNMLEFLLKEEENTDELKTLNPIVLEDVIPKSFPSDAIKIFDDTIPSNLFDIKECIEIAHQENLKVFIYKGKNYIFIDNKLNRVTEKRGE